MRKLFLSVIPVLFFLIGFVGNKETIKSESNDIAGHIYYSDIKTYINGVEVESYNIGGKTAVIIEDITSDYIYDDNERAILVGGYSAISGVMHGTQEHKAFAPENLISTHKKYCDNIGKLRGNIYKTDIRLFIYGEEVLSYNINGKTAVAIEDLGGDKKFSNTGGRYTWDEKSRTINLEFMYNNSLYLVEKNIYLDLKLNDEHDKIVATYKKDTQDFELFYDLYMSNNKSLKIPGMPIENFDKPLIVPVFIIIDNQEIQIGYCFSSKAKAYMQNPFDNDKKEILDKKYEFLYLNNMDALNKLSK